MAAAEIINPEQLQNHSRKFVCSKCTSPGAEAVCSEICCLKAGEVQGRKEGMLSKCFKASPKRPPPTYKFILASATPICPSPLPEAAPGVPSSWALEIAAWDVLFRMVFFPHRRANME